MFQLQMPEVASTEGTSFSVTRAAMGGRPDRWRFMLSFFMVLYSLGAASAISAICRRDG